MRTALEHLLDFIENPGEGLIRTLLFTVLAFGLMGACCGVVLAFAYVGGWYALGVIGGSVALSCAYIAGKDSRKHT